MAGPFQLAPQQTQSNIPTNLFTSTKVKVTNPQPFNGANSMTAGVSPTEFDTVGPGVTEFERSFGGAFLTVKNEGDSDHGNAPLTVETE